MTAAPSWMSAEQAAAFERGVTAADAASAGVVHHEPTQPAFDPDYRPKVRPTAPGIDPTVGYGSDRTTHQSLLPHHALADADAQAQDLIDMLNGRW